MLELVYTLIYVTSVASAVMWWWGYAGFTREASASRHLRTQYQ